VKGAIAVFAQLLHIFFRLYQGRSQLTVPEKQEFFAENDPLLTPMCANSADAGSVHLSGSASIRVNFGLAYPGWERLSMFTWYNGEIK
jgi:hypothetical protein